MERHGIYTALGTSALAAAQAFKVPVYCGTAPVQSILGGSGNVNAPVLAEDLEQAKAALGYSDDWASFTLCEAMYAHFVEKKVGPIVLINVLNPASHKEETGGSKTATPASGKVILTDMSLAVLDTVAITGKTASTYTLSYDPDTEKLTITETASGSLGTEELTITYDIVDPEAVEDDDLIGTYDGEAVSTGLQAIRNVYQLTGYMPGTILCPGFSHLPTVRAAMLAMSQKVNGHWDNMFYTDVPLADGETAMTLSGAAAWKGTNGYNAANEKVFFPMWETLEGKIYHLSVLNACNLAILEAGANGVPYQSASNTALPAGHYYFGEERDTYLPDEEAINEKLNANGITSVAFVAGEWKLWGAHAAAYDAQTDEGEHVSETRRAMLIYLGNRFQIKYGNIIDKSISKNALQSIAAAENEYAQRLVGMGMILYGFCSLVINQSAAGIEELQRGDFSFVYEVTTTPLAKSLTLTLSYTAKGLSSYFKEDA